MNCPNCGRHVRSKTKCAFCGHRFDGREIQEVEKEEGVFSQEPKEASTFQENQNTWYDEDSWFDNEEEEILPKTRRAGGFLKMIWSILKLAFVIFLVFVAIAFGPRYIGKLFESGNPLTRLFNSETTTEEVVTVSEASLEETTTSMATGDLETDVAAYPLTTVTVKLGSNNDQVQRTDLEVGIKANGQETLVENYSILQEGSQVKISFNSPVNQTASEASQQTFFVRSARLGINQEATVTTPQLDIDTARAEVLNKLFSDEVAKQGSVSASFTKSDEKVPYVYNDKARNASHLFTWYILAKTYEAIDAGEMTLEDTVTVLSELVAENDEGLVASTEAGTSFTVEELLNEMVQNRDVSAMNHLIQANGGPNAFNLWLTENNYFSTKVNELLATNADGGVTGVTTSAQDLITLLTKLANDELISQEADTAIKELVINSPATDKYPANLEGVERRFEIVTDDRDAQTQGYAGILQTENDAYVFAVLAEEIANTEEVNRTIAMAIGNAITYSLTDKANFELSQESTDETTVETTEETTEAEPVVEETQAPIQEEVVEQTSTGFQYGPDTDGDGFANTVYDANLGYYREIRWVQGADGLNYFEYIN